MSADKIKIKKQYILGGRVFNRDQEVVGEGILTRGITVPAAKTGTLTTRTDNNTGTLTMTAGHGITTGIRIDIYWTIAGVEYCQRGVTVGTVSVNSVPFDLGVGDNLPAASTAVRVGIPEANVFTIPDGDALEAFVLGCDGATGQFVFSTAVPAELYAKLVTDAFGWHTGDGTCPLTGITTIVRVYMSHGDSDAAHDMRASVLFSA